jgi:hypothetical protein
MHDARARIERLESLGQFGGGGGAAIGPGASTVVWNPGVATSSGNVFKTWAEVVAKVASMQGAVDIVVTVDTAPATIPAGAWDLRPAGVFGPVRLVNGSKTTGPFGAVVTIANAAVTIHGLSGIQDIGVDNQSTSHVITYTAAEQGIFTISGFGAVFQNVLAAGAAFIRITGGVWHTLALNDEASVSTLDTGTNAIQVVAPGILNLFLTDASTFGTNQLSGAAGTVAVSAVNQGTVGFPAYGAQASAANIFPTGLRQKGSNAIVAGTGKTAAIVNDGDGNRVFIANTSRIIPAQKIAANDGGASPTVRYAALTGDRVNGNPGSFKISALTNVGGGDVNVADTSTIDWVLEN